MTAALDRAVANALGLKSVHNCEKWSKTMIEEDDDIQVYKKPWVGLTDEDRKAALLPAYKEWECEELLLCAREDYLLIEQALKEKNNGL